MQTIEQITLMHELLLTLACHPGACRQRIYTLNGWATNQESVSLNFQTNIALRDIPSTDPQFNAFSQGFHCVEINLAAKIGGCHHDGNVRESTEITWHILDRLNGGMAQKTWSNNGCWNSDKIGSEEIVALIKKLIGYQEPDLTSVLTPDFSGLFSGSNALKP